MLRVDISVFKVRSQVAGSKEPRRHKPVHSHNLALWFQPKATGKDVVERLKHMLGDDFSFQFQI